MMKDKVFFKTITIVITHKDHEEGRPLFAPPIYRAAKGYSNKQ